VTTGELYGKPLPGTDSGTCYICGRVTEHGRRKRVAAHNWISQDMPEVWPVAEWSDMDRWAHAVRYALPYSRVYDEKATIEGTYIGLRMRSLFDDGRKGISDSSMDGALFWRDRPHGR